MNRQQCKQAMEKVLSVGLVPLIAGQPGNSKSALVKEYAEANDLELIDIRLTLMDAHDLQGIPKVGDKKVTYMPFDSFPLKGDRRPNKKKGWLLFFDELGNTESYIQACAYKIILDRLVGNTPLHEDVHIICASNRQEDNCFINPMPEALKSRLVHLELTMTYNDFHEYATDVGIDVRILSFLLFKKEMLNNFDPNKEVDNTTYACPRTWSMVNSIIENEPKISDNVFRDIIKGTIGESAGLQFIAFCEYFEKLPKYTDIIQYKAKKIDKDDLGLVWALIGLLIQEFKEGHLPSILTYCEEFPDEIVYYFLVTVTKRYPKLLSQKCMKNWVVKIAKMRMEEV